MYSFLHPTASKATRRKADVLASHNEVSEVAVPAYRATLHSPPGETKPG